MFVDFRVVDDAGKVLPHDGRAQGELQVRGLHVVREYFRVRRPSGMHQLSAITTAHALLVNFSLLCLLYSVHARDLVCANCFFRKSFPLRCLSALGEHCMKEVTSNSIKKKI